MANTGSSSTQHNSYGCAVTNAFKAKLVAKKVSNNTLVYSRSYFLVLYAHRPRVVRHYLTGAGLNSSLKRNKVMLKVVARVCSILPVGKVAVLPILKQAAT